MINGLNKLLHGISQLSIIDCKFHPNLYHIKNSSKIHTCSLNQTKQKRFSRKNLDPCSHSSYHSINFRPTRRMKRLNISSICAMFNCLYLSKIMPGKNLNNKNPKIVNKIFKGIRIRMHVLLLQIHLFHMFLRKIMWLFWYFGIGHFLNILYKSFHLTWFFTF